MNEFRNVTLPVPWGTAGAVVAAKYCNSALVMFSPWEFSFELAQLSPTVVAQGAEPDELPQVALAKVVHDWISMSPPHAKAFLRALAENVRLYEEQHGTIPVVEQSVLEKEESK